MPSRTVVATVGRYGYTVTIERRGRRLYLRWWHKARQAWARRSLGHNNLDLAREQAKTAAADLLAQDEAAEAGVLTVGTLLARYHDQVGEHKARPAEDERRKELWEAFLGAERDVATLDHDLLDDFVRARRHGAVHAGERRFARHVSDTTVGADLIYLMSALNWATRAREGRRPLLATNPLHGYPIPTTPMPRQPVATMDRFEKLGEVADQVDARLGAFLGLVESLGWRVSAVCALRAEDVDRKKRPEAPWGRILKRGETDKEGVQMWVPLSAPARAALDALPATDGYLFPSPKAPERPWTRWHARDLAERAETLAKLEHLEGGLFHPFRRKWATERKHLPDADVMAAGGWRDPRSLKRSYQQTDPATLLAVVTEPRKLREAKA